MPYRQQIAALLSAALKKMDESNSFDTDELLQWVEIPRDSSHGDFAFPCFRLAKTFRKNPAMIAKELGAAVGELKGDFPEIGEIKVLGPYLNLRINKAALATTLIPGILNGEFLAARDHQSEKVMIEYSQPNTHKAFHVGHTRNAALGDALVRIFEWNGFDVIAANYIGDEGAHIAKCLWYLQNHFKGEVPTQNLGEFLGELYTNATILLDFKLLTDVPILDLFTAKVTDIKPHPKRDSWRVVGLANADGGTVQVVCGGQGFQVGDIVAYAGEGARVGGRKIEVAEKEGVLSQGMVCSKKELGLEDVDAIHTFPAETPLGLQVAEYFRKSDGLPQGEPVAEVMKTRLEGVAQTLQKLEAKEAKTIELWEKTKSWSMEEFHKIYDWLGCRFDHYYFESDVGEAGKRIVLDFYKRGVFVKSEGAIGADLSDSNLPFFLLLKSDGTGLYATKDLALARDKFDRFKVDRSIYVVDASQSLHFQQVFATLGKMGYKRASQCFHLAYGLVVLPEGKMSSREGNVILFSQLQRILDEKIRGEYLDKYQGVWSDEEIAEASKRISVATIRYGMLNQDHIKNIVFDLEEWTSRSGNTGPYLLYAYARTRSILREVGEFSSQDADWALLTHETEAALLNQMSKLPEIASRACRDFRPNLICHYLYQLCKDFSRMYDKCSVVRAETQSLKVTRACLVDAFGKLLQKGLALLGIQTLERM